MGGPQSVLINFNNLIISKYDYFPCFKASITRGIPDTDCDIAVYWVTLAGNAEPGGIRPGVMCAKAFKEDECGISVREGLEGQGLRAGGTAQK